MISTHLPGHRQPLDRSTGIPLPRGLPTAFGVIPSRIMSSEVPTSSTAPTSDP
ncbi:hypothetical protein [Actinomyces sp. oral taxon 170]|uniref:hypothetical protein n=1 Tax=Actinomyces sp. oral taxon 170 TaxID=712117 RepID=UPI000205DBE2|nr:hypothetical protein [Actinomyces sp. oral taxon 170]EGF49980.1 conserved domain protein [Actinomyces sp. oral taxon 170 str. F0386]